MSYRVLLERAAQRDFRTLEATVARRVRERLLSLEQNPRPPGVSKLRGVTPPQYRLRVGEMLRARCGSIASSIAPRPTNGGCSSSGGTSATLRGGERGGARTEGGVLPRLQGIATELSSAHLNAHVVNKIF